MVAAKFLFFSLPADGSEPYEVINVDSKTGKHDRNWVQEEHTVNVENIRGNEDSVSLDMTGFQFFHHPARHTSFANDEEIKQEERGAEPTYMLPLQMEDSGSDRPRHPTCEPSMMVVVNFSLRSATVELSRMQALLLQ